MSHTVVQKAAIKDPEALNIACRKLGLAAPVQGSETFYDRSKHTGLVVKLRDWDCPVIIKPETGEVSYDNFGGNWGDQTRLDELFQRYTIEAMRRTAEADSYTFTEVPQSDGEIEVRMERMLN